MRTIYTLLPVMLLTACASVEPDAVKVVEINRPAPPTPSVPRVVINEDCANLARFARSVAVMRDAGVPIEDVNLLITTRPPFQYAPVIREVYSRKDVSPIAGETNSYSVCRTVGYENMIQALEKAEADNAQKEKEKIKATLEERKSRTNNNRNQSQRTTTQRSTNSGSR